MGRWPELAPLLLVLKELLCQRGLNEPFTGGLSSYSLLLLAMTALLQAGVDPLEAPLPRPQHHTPLGGEAAPGAGNRRRPSARRSAADVGPRGRGRASATTRRGGAGRCATRPARGGGRASPRESEAATRCCGAAPTSGARSSGTTTRSATS